MDISIMEDGFVLDLLQVLIISEYFDFSFLRKLLKNVAMIWIPQSKASMNCDWVLLKTTWALELVLLM